MMTACVDLVGGLEEEEEEDEEEGLIHDDKELGVRPKLAASRACQ